MGAKDWKVFLSVPEIDEKLYDKGFTAEECEAILSICKRAGIREVVEWIKQMSHPEYGSPSEGNYWAFSKKMWQAKLKEWGIKVDHEG